MYLIPKTQSLPISSCVFFSPKRSSALHLVSKVIRCSPLPGNRVMIHHRRLPRFCPPQYMSRASAHTDFASEVRHPTPVTSNSRVKSARPPVGAAVTSRGHHDRHSPPVRPASRYLTSDPALRLGPPGSRQQVSTQSTAFRTFSSHYRY